MAKILIDGGKPLSGTIKVSGAKNAALPIIAGVILSTKPVKLTNVPALNDVTTISKVLEALGVKVARTSNNCYEFDASGKISEEDLNYRKMIQTSFSQEISYKKKQDTVD